jgi:hypothetical protein
MVISEGEPSGYGFICAAIQAEELGFADAWPSEQIFLPSSALYPPTRS